ncbi:MAG: NAD-dependent succinate-semialdehyde dehydrogenase [Nitrosomonadaceae bacterium]|nr:NAD-dependent succinate-semialdehyde dehydrogenase [Nitrosospira sp.]MDW7565272.1 NAD-dependent succinate-semialdehyde dehydrogenase [Nitrosomonadaceae bacterium]MBI0409477.1 NAD-dependent succinate-semialdehyde dehydrogenase [Nitrosospira sp.]MBI0410403.1 NAD-dependent succinate-semialdehyde dehydrogenase [Nitrosospira sp.]MBI0411148.1 NAD-dependent succinate-semialdehyde dehydrogenase [Nitrosospira sp.]
MPYISLNPATNKIVKTYTSWDSHHLATALQQTDIAQQKWSQTSFDERVVKMSCAARLLRERAADYGRMISIEMGKPIREAYDEVEKCALICDYYAVHAQNFLRDEMAQTEASRSYVSYQPLGVVLGVMPWNFPFLQVIRFSAPALMAGNGCVLKHASNVPQCGLAIEQLFLNAGFPASLFTTLMIESADVVEAIASRHVHAVTITGSEAAGRVVAAHAGQHLKKCVLELGGSDAFIILKDADLELAATNAVKSRFQNCGQSCIAAKRIIPVAEIADEFVSIFMQKTRDLKMGDPLSENIQMGPLARLDLREYLHLQVCDSIAQGAEALLGCKPISGEGAFYSPSILDRVTVKTRAYHEELFGPVAIVIRATDESEAIHIANDTRFGLGSSIWSCDSIRAEKIARQVHAGSSFINGIVRSDPRLPFGGIKSSGFGRELSSHGIREFVNVKSIWIH